MTETSKFPVYLIDDDTKVLSSLGMVVSGAGYEVKSYSCGRAFAEDLRPELCGCVILDVMLPGSDGIELLSQIREKCPKLRVIMITGHANVPMAVNALKLGAVDFLEKPFHPKDLLEQIEAVQEELQLGESVEETDDPERKPHPRFASLTPREFVVLGGVVRGLSNKEIAEWIQMSLRTVQLSRSIALRKSGFKNRTELMDWIVTNSIPLKSFMIDRNEC